MIHILISGKQGSGKTTTSTKLVEAMSLRSIPVTTYKFAQPIYNIHDLIYMAAESYGIKRPPAGVDGPLLQLLGTEWGRKTKGEDVWIQAAKSQISKMQANWKQGENPLACVIIDDCRFENEFDSFDKKLTVRLECARDLRKIRAAKWREKEEHESEISLDQYAADGKFDLYCDTGSMGVDQVVSEILEHLNKRISWTPSGHSTAPKDSGVLAN